MAPAWPGQLSLAKSKRRVWPRPVSAAAGSQRSKPRDECPALLPPRLAAGSNDPAPWAGQEPRCVPPLGVGESARGVKMPAKRVHNDYTAWSSPKRVRDLKGDEAKELLKHRSAPKNSLFADRS